MVFGAAVIKIHKDDIPVIEKSAYDKAVKALKTCIRQQETYGKISVVEVERVLKELGDL